MVNINIYDPQDEQEMELHSIDSEVAQGQIERLNALKERRDNDRVNQSLEELKEVARGEGNTMYPILEAVRSYATVQEISDALKEVFGDYRETPVI
jgi:methylmalonyl-CoA mutase, N-terminal domain